jgi:hypothetical protein
VVLGGLVTSTFLNLVVVPAGYSMIFGGTRRTARDSTEPARDDGPELAPPLPEPSL